MCKTSILKKKETLQGKFQFWVCVEPPVTGGLRYYYARGNNVLHAPRLVKECDDLGKVDLLDYAYRRKPNSQWVAERVTNITWFITNVPGAS